MPRPLLKLLALFAFGLSPSAHSTVALESYWPLGEGAAIGTDSASGTANPFNKTDGSTIQTASPAVAGSTAYARTSGVSYQGIWMFGVGSTAQTVPADNWGVQFNVRVTALPSSGTYKAVFGMLDAAAGGLVIEANNVSGTTYFDVNRAGQANLIAPRNASTTVTTNTWYNLALVKNGGVLTFYVNGASVGTSTGSIGTTDGLFSLGFQQGVGTRQLAGDFDEARFFTFAPGAFATTDLERLTLAYNGNGNTSGTALVDNGTYYSGTSVTLPSAGSLTKAGSIFIGWNTQANGLGTSYSPATTINIGGSNTTLYAQWAAATATITSATSFPAAVTTTYGSVSGPTSTAVSGVNLSGNITATAPDNLEVSSDNITFGPTATFTQIGGNVSGTLYVRIKSNAPAGAYNSQAVVLTSAGATPISLATAGSGNTVTAKALTVPSATAQSKMYDGTTTGIVIGTFQAAEAFGSGTSSDGIPYIGDTLTLTAPGTFSNSAVGGPYAVAAGTFTLGGTSAGNYTLTQPTLGSLTASILSIATWTELAGGSWTETGNWLDKVGGTGAGNTADFSTLDLIAPTTVTLASPQTIGNLIFGDTTPDYDWTVSGSTLTLSAATTPFINVIDQTTTTIRSALAGTGMIKTGTGTLNLSSITSEAINLTSNEGTLNLAVPFGGLAYNNAGGLANGGTLTVNSGATLQISGAYNIGYAETVNINDGTLDIARNSTGDGQNYTLNLNFTNGGSIISSTGSCLRWGELADAIITVNGTTPANITSILRMIPAGSKTGTINVVDPAGNLDFFGDIIDYPGYPGGVSLIKTGAGTLTLGGTNNYTSNTTVNAGTLILNAGAQLKFVLGATSGATNSISGAGTAVLDGNFAIDTAAAVALSTGSWTLENVASLAGPYGDSFTVVGFEDAGSDKWTKTDGSKFWSFDETTGVLTLSPAAGYDSWKTANGTTQTADLDHDNDGVSNGIEYFLGGNTNTTGFTGLPDVMNIGGVRSITWVNASTYEGTYGTDFFVETSTTLAAGSWATETLGGNITISGDNVTYTFPAGPVKTFARLKVTLP